MTNLACKNDILLGLQFVLFGNLHLDSFGGKSVLFENKNKT